MNKRLFCLTLAASLTAMAFALPPVTNGLIIQLEADSLQLSDGSAVTTWADSATSDSVDGTENQVSGYGTPVFKTNIINGLPVVRFTDDILNTAAFDLPAPTGGVTVFAVFTGDSSGECAERMAQIGIDAGTAGSIISLDASTNNYLADGGSGFRFNNGKVLAKVANPLTTDFHVATWKFAQGAAQSTAVYYVDGVLTALDYMNAPTTTCSLAATGNYLHLGTGRQSSAWMPGDYYTGDIAEMIVYNAQLTANQITQVNDYLINKYNLAPQPVENNAVIHLDADSLNLQNGAQVTSWSDSATGDSINGTVSSVAGRGTPIYVSSGCNGLPAVRFVSGENDVLASSLFGLNRTQGVTIFTVCTGGLSTPQRALQIGATGGTDFQSFACDVSSNQSGARFNNGTCLADSPFLMDEWHLSVRQIDNNGRYGSLYYTVDDVTYLPKTTDYPDRRISFPATGNDLTIGAGAQSGSLTDWYDGDIAEIIVYNKLLTPAEIKAVTNSLNAKYAIYASTANRKFTIAAFPDSQGMTESTAQPASVNLLINLWQFVADNIPNMNIIFATHEGDFTTTSNAEHFGYAASAADKLANTIPISMVPGNHDYDDTATSRNSTLWNEYLGPNKYSGDKGWYGGAYLATNQDSTGMSTYQTFSTDSINFLHIGLEIEPSDAVLAWAQDVINAHAGMPTIVTTHEYLSATTGTYGSWTNRAAPKNNPIDIWNEFIKVNPQIFMVLSGHSYDGDYHVSVRKIATNNAGYPVYELMFDTQNTYSGAGLGNGGGWVRLMEVDPAANTIRVRSYSTILNKFSSDPTLTDGSTYARQWAAFNYDSNGTGALFPESNWHAAEYTIPFIYGYQLPWPGDDTTPPSPDPMTWASVPAATDSSTITMTATTATDPSGVEYFFDETSGNPGGTDSGWQASPIYTDTGLSEGTTYSYTVKARDLSAGLNETAVSTVGNATTPDVTAPTPNPMTWASVPAATGTSTIAMTATTASDISGVEYYFDETSGNPGGTDSGWQASPSYTDTGLSAGTTYSYTVKARDLSAGLNETAVSTVGNATTNAAVPTFVAAGAVASGTGAITPALPSGIAAGDILLLFLETSNQAISISNQNGGTWTAVTNSPQYCGTAASTTGARLTVFWSRYNGTQGAPTTSDSGNHQLGRMIAIRNAASSGNPWDVTAGGVEAVDDTSGSIPGATTTVANTLVVTAIATSLPDASSTAKFSGWTNANLTSLTERTDNSVTAGNGGGLAIATGFKATAGAYGNTAVTLVNAAYKGMISIAIKP